MRLRTRLFLQYFYLLLIIFPVTFLTTTTHTHALKTDVRKDFSQSSSSSSHSDTNPVATSVLIRPTPPPTPDGTLLVSTLDGTLHALDLRSGDYLWSFGSGSSLLHSTFEKQAKQVFDPPPTNDPTMNELNLDLDEDEIPDHAALHQLLTQHEQLEADLNADLASHNLIFDQDEEEHTGHPHHHIKQQSSTASSSKSLNRPAHATNGTASSSPLMIPGVDGSLFYSGTHGLQRLPINVAELVEAAPFKTGDNTRYLGFKETNVFLIHRNTGQLKRVFSPMQTNKFTMNEECEDDECDPNLIWVARTDLTVHAIDGRSGKLRWNVSISTYAPFDNTDSMAEFTETELNALGYPEIGVSVSGTVYAVDIVGHRILWHQSLNSPITSVFLVRPEHPLDEAPFADPEANFRLNQGDMIKIPHFYFDMPAHAVDSDGKPVPPNPLKSMVEHYHRSRDLTDVTTFTYIGQTKNGLIYALPNPQPLSNKSPLLVDQGKDNSKLVTTKNPFSGPTKPQRGHPTIPAIDIKPHSDSDTVHAFDDNIDENCIPDSPIYPSCLIGFHPIHHGMTSTTKNQQLISTANIFYNNSVKPRNHPIMSDEEFDKLVGDNDDSNLHRPRDLPKVIIPPYPHSPPSYWDSLNFWWPVLIISIVLSVVVSVTLWTLQRMDRRKRNNSNAKNKKGKKGGKNNNLNEDEAAAEDVTEEKEDGGPVPTMTAGMRKRNKKEALRGVFPVPPTIRQTSEPTRNDVTSSSVSPPVLSPNSSGTLVARKTHFSTYESDVPIIPSATAGNGSSGDVKTIRPRKHIQTRPDPKQMNDDAASSSKSPTLNKVFSTTHNNPDGSVSIGNMVLYPQKVLGTGSMGTVVYAGTFGGRPCAIKRLVKPFFGSANAAQEIALLIQSDQHPNVLRYYAKDEDTSFIYLALEQCVGTIQDLVDDNKLQLEQTKAVLYGMMTGLAHLHSLHIVHRDIKPGNILLTSSSTKGATKQEFITKLADMGLGKQLSMTRSSFDSVVSGSIGWQAPEVLNADGGRLTKAVDVFSAGCVMHFVLTKGQHPFGDNVERELNIVSNRMDLSGLADLPEARDLIGCMLHPDPSLRMSAEDVCAHPFFWSPAKQLSFLLEASDRFESEPEHSELRMCLESQAAAVVGDNWHTQLNQGLLDNLHKYRKYDFSSVRDCLRVIRNKKNHYRDLPEDVRREVGVIPEGFLNYFTSKFPALLIYIYSVLSCFCLESPASSCGDQYSYSPLDLDHSHSSPYDADLHQENVQAFYHKPLINYPELKFSSPQFEQFYAQISLRRLIQLQKHTRLRFRHWHVHENEWIGTQASATTSTTTTRKGSADPPSSSEPVEEAKVDWPNMD